MVMSRHQTEDASSLDVVEVKEGVSSGMDIDLCEDFIYLKRSLGGVTMLSLYDRFGSPVTFGNSLDINTHPCSSIVQCQQQYGVDINYFVFQSMMFSNHVRHHYLTCA